MLANVKTVLTGGTCRAGLAVGAAAMLVALNATTALAGVPFPTRATPGPVDIGALDASAASKPITVTIALKLHHSEDAEVLLRRVSTPGDVLYRKFLTPAEFRDRFGPTDADVQAVRESLGKFGLTVERASTTTLRVTGAPANLERAFQVSLHSFSVAAHGGTPGYTFRAPLQTATLPAEIAPVAHTVLGLDTRPALHPHTLRAPEGFRPATAKLERPGTQTADAPGDWTVKDFAAYYHVTPLYQAKIDGTGQTVGIATFASFTPSDAYTYWSGIGLKVSQTRITEVPVDGGSGPPSDAAGSFETTLDVEQSGGVARGANILVYEAPNTNQGQIDLLAKAIDDNMADAISQSWGEWEWYGTVAASGTVTNDVTGKQSSILAAIHQLLLQAGIQGQSVITSAGDQGSYDANNGAAPPDFSLALSVDSPGSDTAITAAGGTTVPATITFTSPAITVTIPAERVWSWDYLVPLCNALSLDPIACGIFPVGGGGGVSVEFPLPAYQKGVGGIQLSQANQQFIDEDTVPPTVIYTLPAYKAGRNVPDISLNSDPETGYAVGYTSSAAGSTYGVQDFWGGTSFAAPQLNGITQLLDQNAGKRLGLLNPALYKLAATPTNYGGAKAPFRYIKTGNNDFYVGSKGYNPGAGLGTVEVNNLAAATK